MSVSKYSANYPTNTLYTKGGQFTLESTGQEYRGPYHLLEGVAFTGKPKSANSLRLLPIIYDQFSTYTYDKQFEFKNPAKTHTLPIYFRPQPSASDYTNGYFYRYLVTHNLNKTKVPTEISVAQANSYGKVTGIDAGLYTLHRIKWTIVGATEDYQTKGGVILSIENANRKEVSPLIRRYPLIDYAFKNYNEFARITMF